MQHRIIVVDTLAGVPVADAQRHWRSRHAEVYAPTPLLVGYVQNRPLEEEWERLGTRSICSETWFAGREEERASFACDYYRDVVMPDENRFLDRASAWPGRVVAEAATPVGSARYRVLAFGTPLGGADVIEVDRVPWCGGGPVVTSLWLDDRKQALELARSAPAFAYAAEPAVVVAPPG
jgi:EthD domain-containing protein